MRSQWKNQTKIPKNGQIMAVSKFLLEVSCNLTHTGNLLIFSSSRKKIHTELHNYSKCLVDSSYEALWTGLNHSIKIYDNLYHWHYENHHQSWVYRAKSSVFSCFTPKNFDDWLRQNGHNFLNNDWIGFKKVLKER